MNHSAALPKMKRKPRSCPLETPSNWWPGSFKKWRNPARMAGAGIGGAHDVAEVELHEGKDREDAQRHQCAGGECPEEVVGPECLEEGHQCRKPPRREHRDNAARNKYRGNGPEPGAERGEKDCEEGDERDEKGGATDDYAQPERLKRSPGTKAPLAWADGPAPLAGEGRVGVLLDRDHGDEQRDRMDHGNHAVAGE